MPLQNRTNGSFRLISAHFLRVAAEFTGREKYKTPSRAHGCLRRAGKRDKAVEFAIVPEEVLIPTAVLGVIEHVAGNSARISEKVMQSATILQAPIGVARVAGFLYSPARANSPARGAIMSRASRPRKGAKMSHFSKPCRRESHFRF
jgi:hypothetical protein